MSERRQEGIRSRELSIAWFRDHTKLSSASKLAFHIVITFGIPRRFLWSDAIQYILIFDPISGVKFSKNQVKIESHHSEGIVSVWIRNQYGIASQE